jgi:hypothetical protein
VEAAGIRAAAFKAVDVHPHAYIGKVLGCSTWLSAGVSGFSSLSGLAPTFLIEPK